MSSTRSRKRKYVDEVDTKQPKRSKGRVGPADAAKESQPGQDSKRRRSSRFLHATEPVEQPLKETQASDNAAAKKGSGKKGAVKTPSKAGRRSKGDAENVEPNKPARAGPSSKEIKASKPDAAKADGSRPPEPAKKGVSRERRRSSSAAALASAKALHQADSQQTKAAAQKPKNQEPKPQKPKSQRAAQPVTAAPASEESEKRHQKQAEAPVPSGGEPQPEGKRKRRSSRCAPRADMPATENCPGVPVKLESSNKEIAQPSCKSPLSPKQDAAVPERAPPPAQPPLAAATPVPKKPITEAFRDPDWFNPVDSAKVAEVEAVLHVAQAGDGSLPLCRESQARELQHLIDLHVGAGSGGAIYVCGIPGTGKSLTVHEVVRQCWAAATVPTSGQPGMTAVSVNCMALTQPAAVFGRALEGLRGGVTAGRGDPITYPGGGQNGAGGSGCEDSLQALKELVTQPQGTPAKRAGKRGMLLLILDEMDRLASQDRGILHELFSLPQLPGSRLILVGISNSLDLLERVLPRIGERGPRPHHLPFPSYAADQVSAVLQSRLACLPGPTFQPHAVAFCARKVAAQSGDMRRALQACSLAVRQLVTDCTSTAEPGDDTQGDMPEGSASQPPPAVRRLVGLGHMAAAVAAVQGGSGEAAASVQAMKALPPQQQLVLCAAAKLLGQIEAAESGMTTNGAAPGTPQSTAKIVRHGSVSLLGCSPARPRGTASPSVARSRLLGSTQESGLGRLHDAYCQLCKKISMQPLNSTEFAAACSTLADLGLLALDKAREQRLRQVRLRVHRDDVALALQDRRMLRNLLSLS